jgi:rfaE bifunctional protein nucleotidyltransferase chain/domain
MGRVLSLDDAVSFRAHCSRGALRVVFTNGHFDLLHAGHVRYLQAARDMGDVLIVGVNSDGSSRARKPGRPLVPEQDRAELLAALACVDAVVIFDDPTAVGLVEALRPEVYVKGADWDRPGGPRPPEADTAQSYGGEVCFVPYEPDRSTTLIIARIRALPEE